MMRYKISLCLLLGVWLVVLLASCRHPFEAEPIAEVEPGPPPIVAVLTMSGLPDSGVLREQVERSLQQRFPQYEVTFAAPGQPADILLAGLSRFEQRLLPRQQVAPLLDKVRQSNPSLDHYGVLRIMAAVEHRELYGLPLPPPSPYVLFYNEELFDLFGVPYPQDRMLWDDLLALSRRMTRFERGQATHGIVLDYPSLLKHNPYAVPAIDPQENRLGDPVRWKAVFELFRSFYTIPGNDFIEGHLEQMALFRLRQTAAMALADFGWWATFPDELRWNMAAFPLLPEQAAAAAAQRSAEASAGAEPQYWFISAASEQQDDAFRIIRTLSVEDKPPSGATSLLRSTRPTGPWSLPDSHKLAQLHSKRIQAIYVPAAFDAPVRRGNSAAIVRLYSNSELYLRDAFIDMIQGERDINSVLRIVDEQIQRAFKSGP